MQGTARLTLSVGVGTVPGENGRSFGFEQVFRSGRQTTTAWPTPDQVLDVALSILSLDCRNLAIYNGLSNGKKVVPVSE